MTAVDPNAIDTAEPVEGWIRICPADAVPVDRGVAALVGSTMVAIFRLSPLGDGPEEWFAVSHIDPRTGAPVMARGLIGSVERAPEAIATVASPLHKERYDLRTGVCLDGQGAGLEVFELRIIAQELEVKLPSGGHRQET